MKLDDFPRAACWLASLAYASGFKRAGKSYLAGAVAALALDGGAIVVNVGRLPANGSAGRTLK